MSARSMAHTSQQDKWKASAAALRSTLRRKNTRGKQTIIMQEFGTYFNPNWEEIVSDDELGRMELRLLLLSAACVDKNNVLPYSQVQLAKKLKVSRQAVQHAMAVLVDKGLMLQDGHTYQLNSRLATHAGLVDLIELRREERQRLKVLGMEAEL